VDTDNRIYRRSRTCAGVRSLKALNRESDLELQRDDEKNEGELKAAVWNRSNFKAKLAATNMTAPTE
jgi:hypothetical protein